MARLPQDPKKIRESIKRYERSFAREQKTFGAIQDGSGNRYLVGSFYLLLGDLEGTLKSFAWFDQSFPDDMGEPVQYLCWTLALYRSGDVAAATSKLRQTMLMNLYLLPHLFGLPQESLDIWHGSNWTAISYAQETPPEFLALWDEAALRWAKECYNSPAFTQVRNRYIAIYQQLKTEHPGPVRQQLVREAGALRDMA